MAGGDRKIWGQWDGMQGEMWREPKGVEDTQRDRHEGWMQREVKRLEKPSHGKRDKERQSETEVWGGRQRSTETLEETVIK